MATRKRSGAIGGLLSVPQALPDDDDTARRPQTSAQPVVEAPTIEAVPEPEQVPERPSAPARGDHQGSGRKGPPSTIRLNEVAGPSLWDAYTQAKAADPFLSYRQFASAVVLDGLAAHEKRRKR